MRTKGLNIRIPRLGINRFGVYFVRSSAPGANGRRKVVQQSLGTKNPRLAKLLALKFCLSLVSEDLLTDFRDRIGRYEIDLATGKAKADGPEDHARMVEAMKLMQDTLALQAQLQPPQAPLVSHALSKDASDIVTLASQVLATGLPSFPKPTNAGKKLRQALDDHLEEEAKRVKADATVKEKRAVFKEFSDFFGDIYLNAITKDDISERWRRAEFKRPNQKRKGETLSLARLEKRRGYIAKFFTWAVDSGAYFHEHPVKQQMATKKEIEVQRVPWAEFNEDDLKRLFSASFRTRMQEPDWYWLPLISLYSGARLAEIGALRLAAFMDVEGTKVMCIKDAKSPSGIRTVPIHSTLLELGLWDYVENLRVLGFDRFLPHRPATKSEKMAGRMWGKWVSECGITDDAKVFHSFRSTAITDMHNSEASHAGIHRTVGHATSGVKGAHGGYVRGIKLLLLKKTIETLEYGTYSDMERVLDEEGAQLEEDERHDLLKRLARAEHGANAILKTGPPMPPVDATGLVAIGDIARSVARLIRVILLGYAPDEVEELTARMQAERTASVDSEASGRELESNHQLILDRLDGASDQRRPHVVL